MNRRMVKWPGVVTGVLLPLISWGNPGGIDVGLSASSQYTNNALKSLDDKMSERQDRYLLLLASDYANDLLDVSANYRATHYQFSENSQVERSLWEGDASLLLGKAHHPVELQVRHSRRARLNAPGQVDLLQNVDEQQVTSAMPAARFRLSAVDYLLLRGNYTEVDYRFASGRNSSRQGGSVLWLHQLSPVDSMQVSVQRSDVEFEIASDFDYSYQSAAIAYAAQLRQLNYRLELGYNNSYPVLGQRFSSPTYRLDVDYTSGNQQFNLSADQYITDTSMGGRNNSLDEPDLGGVAISTPDQLERSTLDARWKAEIFCSRCTFTAGAIYQKDVYRVLNEDGSERSLSLGASYAMSSASRLRLGFDRRDYRYAQGVEREDYRLERTRIEYRHRLANQLGVQCYLGYEARTQETVASNYTQTFVGLSFDYDI